MQEHFGGLVVRSHFQGVWGAFLFYRNDSSINDVFLLDQFYIIYSILASVEVFY